jgi:hydroxymethylpyrimidine pyrophosphatase-like HAD family hydrolase
MIWDTPIPKEKVLRIIQACEENNTFYSLQTEQEILANELKNNVLFYESENKKKKRDKQTTIRIVPGLKENIQENVYKIVLSNSNKKIFNNAIKIIRKISGIRILAIPHKARRITSINGKDVKLEYYYTEITEKNSNKWNAIKEIMKKMHITKEEVMAIGDNMNDSLLIRKARLRSGYGKQHTNIKKAGRHCGC